MNKKYEECQICGTKKKNPKSIEIWLSEEGYCSICYHKIKEAKEFTNMKSKISKIKKLTDYI